MLARDFRVSALAKENKGYIFVHNDLEEKMSTRNARCCNCIALGHEARSRPKTARKSSIYNAEKSFLNGSINSDGNPATKLQLIEKAMTKAAATTIMADERRRPVWFEAASTVLNKTINTRNQASSEYFNNTTNEIQLKLKKTRKE
jgi:hypothetical protein